MGSDILAVFIATYGNDLPAMNGNCVTTAVQDHSELPANTGSPQSPPSSLFHTESKPTLPSISNLLHVAQISSSPLEKNCGNERDTIGIVGPDAAIAYMRSRIAQQEPCLRWSSLFGSLGKPVASAETFRPSKCSLISKTPDGSPLGLISTPTCRSGNGNGTCVWTHSAATQALHGTSPVFNLAQELCHGTCGTEEMFPVTGVSIEPVTSILRLQNETCLSPVMDIGTKSRIFPREGVRNSVNAHSPCKERDIYEPQSFVSKHDLSPAQCDKLATLAMRDHRHEMGFACRAIGVQPRKQIACEICHKSFERPSALRVHKRSHSGEKPFNCAFVECKRTFSTRSNMKRHLKVHRAPAENRKDDTVRTRDVHTQKHKEHWTLCLV